MHREELELAEKALGEREKEAKVSTQSVSVYVGMFLGVWVAKVTLLRKEMFRFIYRENVYNTITTKKSNFVQF